MGGGGRRTEEDMSPDEDSDTEEYRTSFNDVDLVTAGLSLVQRLNQAGPVLQAAFNFCRLENKWWESVSNFRNGV